MQNIIQANEGLSCKQNAYRMHRNKDWQNIYTENVGDTESYYKWATTWGLNVAAEGMAEELSSTKEQHKQKKRVYEETLQVPCFELHNYAC